MGKGAEAGTISRVRIGRCGLALISLFGVAACVTQPPGQVADTHAPAVMPAPASAGVSAVLALPPPSLAPSEVDVEALRLHAALAREVPDATAPTPEAAERWIDMTKTMLARHHAVIERPQILVVVDRNPRVQQLALVVAQPDARWLVIGSTRVSTGQPNRHGYYITPTGVFVHDASILDYRAEGTFNEHHVRGLGLKGMRVWDFGWQSARKGWLGSDERGDIRLLMHATDPANLAHRIGRPASEGCVRVPADMNRFMDRHSVLDSDYLQAAAFDDQYDRGIRALLPADREPTPLAGDMLVIVDSSEPSFGTVAIGGAEAGPG